MTIGTRCAVDRSGPVTLYSQHAAPFHLFLVSDDFLSIVLVSRLGNQERHKRLDVVSVLGTVEGFSIP